ncbi:SDR family NAD(P)-dependent oxidoreductase [Streptomyces shenzhenensis]|uniref:SDR family NAD(P)-dependent oxidoreductase n=1 Tax=Streptomyces shenzhenensis TaxID=943815 RepID=UPI003D8A9C7C
MSTLERPAGERPVALVAGASSGIGSAIARRLAADGYRCVLHCRHNRAHADAVAAGLPGAGHLVAPADLTQPSDITRLVRTVRGHTAAWPTVVVNCAHPAPHIGDLVDVTPDAWTTESGAVAAHLALISAFVPPMVAARRGCLVAISGGLARRHSAGLGLYGAAKAAVEALTRTLALEVGRYGVRANVVAPGRLANWTDEPGVETDAFARLDAATKARRALPGLPTAQDIAEVVGFLVSPAAAALSGHIIDVNSGEQIG